MSNTSNLLRGFPKKEKDNIKFRVNKPLVTKAVKGDVGLELEVEGRGLPDQDALSDLASSTLKRRWAVHTDGSLRNGGLEYVLDQPCLQEEVPELVEGLFKIFDTNKTKLDLSQRTSTHVHINVSTLKANILTSYLSLWYIFEEALVNWCGEQRAGNLFCLRAKDTSFIPDQWAKALNTGVFKFPNDYKYSSLNLGAFSRFGSFEFRSLRGAESPELVIKWVNLLMALRKEAETEFDNPSVIVERLSGEGPDTLFMEICRKHNLEDFATEILELPENADFNRMCWNGFRNIQKIIYEINWDSVIDKCREPYVPDPFKKEKKSFFDMPAEAVRPIRGVRLNTRPPLVEPADGINPFADRPAPIPRHEDEPGEDVEVEDGDEPLWQDEIEGQPWNPITNAIVAATWGIGAAGGFPNGYRLASVRRLGGIIQDDLKVVNGEWYYRMVRT